MAAYRTTLRDSIHEPHAYRLPMPVVLAMPNRLPADLTSLSIELMLAAQRCTDPLSMLNELFDRVSPYLPIEGFSWRQDSDEVHTQNFVPKPERGQCIHEVELSRDDVHLGKLGIHAQRRLSDAELSGLERIIQSIAFALHNSLLYQRALSDARQDPLTCLKNRRSFDAQLARDQAQFVRYGIKSCLVTMDLNSFKSINDTWGHDVGDRVLKLFATGLTHILRETDHAFRLGGDEFCAILSATNAYGAKKMTDRLDAWLLSHAVELQSGERITIHTAYGLAETEQGSDERDWFRKADQDLYANKRASKRTAA